MKIQISSRIDKDKKITGLLYHDIYGNLYLKINNIYYVLFVNNTDELEWIEIYNYNSLPLVNINYYPVYSKIKNTFEKNSLKGKIIKEINDDNISKNEEDYDDPDDSQFIVTNKLYPEEKLYMIENDNTENDIDNLFDDFEPYYKFSKFGSNIISCLDRTLDDVAMYDTFIINYDTSYVLEIMQSTEISSYRISVFTNNKFSLNIVGSKIKIFDCVFSEMENGIINLYFELNKINNII